MQQQGYINSSSSSARASSSVHFLSHTQSTARPLPGPGRARRVLAVTHRSGVYGETRRVNPSARVLSSSPSATGMNTIFFVRVSRGTGCPTHVSFLLLSGFEEKNVKWYHQPQPKSRKKKTMTTTTTTTAKTTKKTKQTSAFCFRIRNDTHTKKSALH